VRIELVDIINNFCLQSGFKDYATIYTHRDNETNIKGYRMSVAEKPDPKPFIVTSLFDWRGLKREANLNALSTIIPPFRLV